MFEKFLSPLTKSATVTPDVNMEEAGLTSETRLLDKRNQAQKVQKWY